MKTLVNALLKTQKRRINTAALTTIDVKPRASKREITTSSDRIKVLLIRWLIR